MHEIEPDLLICYDDITRQGEFCRISSGECHMMTKIIITIPTKIFRNN